LKQGGPSDAHRFHPFTAAHDTHHRDQHGMDFSVTCPAGATPGSFIPIQTPDGQTHSVQVPANVSPGQTFLVKVATATPVQAGYAPPAVVVLETEGSMPRRSTMSQMRDADTKEQIGYANACCVVVIGIITFIITIWLSGSIGVWYSSGKCYWTWVCCGGTFGCSRWCWREVCNNGVWVRTWPITQDMLPPPQGYSIADPVTNTTTRYDAPGDGIYDYWSLMVAAVLGPIAALVMICIACSPRKDPNTRRAHAACTFCAFVLHATTVVCLGLQFFEQHDTYTFYDAFGNPSYVDIKDTTIIAHMKSDGSNYRYFANSVITAFAFTVFMSLQECCWFAMLTKGDERLVQAPNTFPRRSSRGSTSGGGCSFCF